MDPKLIEALAWLKQAEDLLDQADANLKDLGLDCVWITCKRRASIMSTSDLRALVEDMARQVNEIAEKMAGQHA